MRIKAGCGHEVNLKDDDVQLPLYCVECGLDVMREHGLKRTVEVIEEMRNKRKKLRTGLVNALLGALIFAIVGTVIFFLRSK